MNNQADKFHQENGKIIQQLIESLDAILNKFDEGIIPGEPEKSDAIYMLETYLDYLIKFKETKISAFNKLQSFGIKDFDEKKSIEELTLDKECINVLLKLGREKMILTDDAIFYTRGGKNMLENGYCDEVIAGTSDTHYYILSEKGEKAIQNKSVIAAIRSISCSAIIPQKILNESYKWSNLYVRRVEMINKYFREKRNNAEHIIFSLDDSKELVFGCEINDSEEVDYIFAGIFDEKIDEHIFQISSIANSGRIDHLIILNSNEDGKTLLNSEGLDSTNYPQIQYELLN